MAMSNTRTNREVVHEMIDQMFDSDRPPLLFICCRSDGGISIVLHPLITPAAAQVLLDRASLNMSDDLSSFTQHSV
jgi:hypothetical protein